VAVSRWRRSTQAREPSTGVVRSLQGGRVLLCASFFAHRRLADLVRDRVTNASPPVLVFADGHVATLEGARPSTNGSDAYVEVGFSAQCDALTSIVGIYCRHLGLAREKCLAIASRRRSTLELARSYRCVPYVGGLHIEAPQRSFEGYCGSAPGRVLPSPLPYVSTDKDIDVVSDAVAQGALDVAERAPAIEAAARAGHVFYRDPAAARDLEAQLTRAAGERTGKTPEFITAYASSAAAAAYDVVGEVVVALLKTESGRRKCEDAALAAATDALAACGAATGDTLSSCAAVAERFAGADCAALAAATDALAACTAATADTLSSCAAVAEQYVAADRAGDFELADRLAAAQRRAKDERRRALQALEDQRAEARRRRAELDDATARGRRAVESSRVQAMIPMALVQGAAATSAAVEGLLRRFAAAPEQYGRDLERIDAFAIAARDTAYEQAVAAVREAEEERREAAAARRKRRQAASLPAAASRPAAASLQRVPEAEARCKPVARRMCGWGEPEVTFAYNVTVRFAEGTLPNCPEGANLVEYLASLLHCKRSRVKSRLLAYDKETLNLGPFKRSPTVALSDAERAELCHLEVLFQESVCPVFPPTGL